MPHKPRKYRSKVRVKLFKIVFMLLFTKRNISPTEIMEICGCRRQPRSKFMWQKVKCSVLCFTTNTTSRLDRLSSNLVGRYPGGNCVSKIPSSKGPSSEVKGQIVKRSSIGYNSKRKHCTNLKLHTCDKDDRYSSNLIKRFLNLGGKFCLIEPQR